MILWRTIGEILANWTDTVATGVIALTSRFFSPKHPNLTAAGTVAGEGVAVFIDTTTRNTERLHAGEGHSGWILQSVEHSATTLQKGQQAETLAGAAAACWREASAPVVTAPAGAITAAIGRVKRTAIAGLHACAGRLLTQAFSFDSRLKYSIAPNLQ